MTTGRSRPSIASVFLTVSVAVLLCLNPAASHADYSFDFIRLEHRIFENASDNHDRLAFMLTDSETGDPVTEDVFKGGYIKLGDEYVPGAGISYLYEYKGRSYDDITGDWVEFAGGMERYYRYKFTDPLVVGGTYDIYMEFTNGQDEELKLTYPGYEDLPFVSSSSFDFCFTELGDLVWKWELPEVLSDDLELMAYIGSFEGDAKEVYLVMPGSFESVVIPKEYLEFLGYSDLDFSVSLREDRVNRAYSNTVTIADLGELPTCAIPEPSTLALVAMGLLGMLGLRKKSHRR